MSGAKGRERRRSLMYLPSMVRARGKVPWWAARLVRPARSPMQMRVSRVEMSQLRLSPRESGIFRKVSRRLSI